MIDGPRPEPGMALGIARAGRVVDRVLAEVRRLARPGIDAGRLEQAARGMLAGLGASPAMLGYRDALAEHPYPAAIGVALNDRITGSGNPETRLAAGDLVTLDLAAELNGWHADAAVSFVVSGEDPDDPNLTARRRSLAAAAAFVTKTGVDALTPGRPWSAVAEAMRTAAARAGVAVLAGFDGHGVGRSMHAPPRLPTGPDDPDAGFMVRPGMAVAIEPVVAWRDPGFVRNGWEDRTTDGSDACFAECTVVVGRSRNLVVCGGSWPPCLHDLRGGGA